MIDPITRHLQLSAGRNGPVMLMYHAVERDDSPSWPWSISLKRFAEHLDFLRDYGWTTRLMRELDATGGAPLPDRTVVITFDDGFANNLDAVEALTKRDMLASWFVVTGAIGKVPHWSDSGRPPGRALDSTELQDMATAGMEIGSHSVNHLRLPQLSDEALQHEVRDSKARLEDVLGTHVESFAYPFGDWDARAAAMVEEAGYARACTTQTGWALKDNNPFTLRRLTVYNHDTASKLARKLVFGSNDGRWDEAFRYLYGRGKGHLKRIMRAT